MKSLLLTFAIVAGLAIDYSQAIKSAADVVSDLLGSGPQARYLDKVKSIVTKIGSNFMNPTKIHHVSNIRFSNGENGVTFILFSLKNNNGCLAIHFWENRAWDDVVCNGLTKRADLFSNGWQLLEKTILNFDVNSVHEMFTFLKEAK